MIFSACQEYVHIKFLVECLNVTDCSELNNRPMMHNYRDVPQNSASSWTKLDVHAWLTSLNLSQPLSPRWALLLHAFLVISTPSNKEAHKTSDYLLVADGLSTPVHSSRRSCINVEQCSLRTTGLQSFNNLFKTADVFFANVCEFLYLPLAKTVAHYVYWPLP
jgi:hypothetical protein